MNKFSTLFFGLIFLICGCSSKTEYFEYQDVNGKTWKSTDSIFFNFEVKDTINTKNLFIHIRNTQKYPFSNLYVITQLQYPNQNILIDTLQYQMADENGKLLGKGLSTQKESKLYYKENFRFLKPGKYQLNIHQAMRKNTEVKPIDLNGVKNVGFSIEKSL